jgi:hypothetical protein
VGSDPNALTRGGAKFLLFPSCSLSCSCSSSIPEFWGKVTLAAFVLVSFSERRAFDQKRQKLENENEDEHDSGSDKTSIR